MIFVVGCGDNLKGEAAGSDGGGGGGSDGGGTDATAVQCDPPATGAPGSACTDPADCDSEEGAGDGRCLNADQRDVNWPETGFCVQICPAEATDCGEGTFCFAQEGVAQVLCLPTCCEGTACATGYACSTAFLGEDIGAAVCMPGDQSAADGTPCASVAECDLNSSCDPDQSETTGVCTTVGCDVDDDSTCAPGGDGHCVDEDGGDDLPPHCVDPCETTEDCATDDGQICVDSGDDDIGLFCRHSEIGDPCAAEGACGQAPWDCKTEADDDFPGGYCTLPCGDGCPDDAVCNDLLFGGTDAPYCVEACTLADGCPREGYECLDVSTDGSILRGCVPIVL